MRSPRCTSSRSTPYANRSFTAQDRVQNLGCDERKCFCHVSDAARRETVEQREVEHDDQTVRCQSGGYEMRREVETVHGCEPWLSTFSHVARQDRGACAQFDLFRDLLHARGTNLDRQPDNTRKNPAGKSTGHNIPPPLGGASVRAVSCCVENMFAGHTKGGSPEGKSVHAAKMQKE